MAYQVSIFLENKTGHFERITGILRDENINIRSMTLTHTVSGWGIINLLVDQPENACKILSEKGVSAVLRKVLVFGMEDHPGGLDEILVQLAKAGINFLNAYGRVLSESKKALLIIDAEEIEIAEQKLTEIGLQPLDDKTVYGV